MERAPARRARALDLTVYTGATAFALVTAFASEFYGYRVWANFATPAYLVALALTLLGIGSRWLPVWISAAVATVAPLLYLSFRRDPGFTWGPWPWSFPSQPEVWVIERSARSLLARGTPYLDLATLGPTPHADDYTPYGPSMTLFGFPRALFGDHPLTDARVAFLVVTAAALVAAWLVAGRPAVPARAGQLLIASPLTALTLAVAGDDVAVLALIVLACALAYRGVPAGTPNQAPRVPVSPWWTAGAGALAAVLVTMKLTAVPAAAVLAIGVLASRGSRALAVFLGSLAVVGAAIVLPVLLVDPTAFVEHVVKFPVGLGRASSPASSPLPGHLLAGLGPVGHTAALVLLGLAACVVACWVAVRPPRTAADAVLRVAVGLGAAIVLLPATRWGYLVYPVALLGAALAFAAARVRVGTGEPASVVGSSADTTVDTSSAATAVGPVPGADDTVDRSRPG
ncbi:glycosyltransferase 87 family protein [Actinokineospora enzanensis]|uniref:glycosyltransferase 87 family protein n=1 Tax=Actinokineospora enzanensis TaxID=155975 RepID=UPI000365F34F|nr:glycosyltransferase 87 family protein [Actinokineospora enzanensis]